MSERTSDQTRELITTARKRFDLASTAEAQQRKEGLDDLRFINGDHWTKAAKQDRGVGTREERPTLTVNKFPTLIHQVTNDQRQNRPSINVSPDGEGAEEKVAQMMRGKIRAIQRESDAEIAIDTAFQGAAGPGWGYWRIGTEYEGDTFDQKLVWKRIRNAFTVYADPASQDPTTADKKWCFVSDMVPKDDFKARWPNAAEVNFDSTAVGDRGNEPWLNEDFIRVCEYWVVENSPGTLVLLANGFIGFKDKLAPDVLAQIEADSEFVVSERKADRLTVCCYTITHAEVLEETEWEDEIIPIIRVIGDELDIEGKVTLSGIVRHGKDPARMYNYGASAEAERVGLSPKAPWVAAEGQLENHLLMWKQSNRKNFAVLQYKPVSLDGKPVPPPARQQPVGADQGILALKEAASQDLLGTTGIRFDATKNERTVDESGIALQHLRSNTDLGAFHYHDNLARALKVTGGIFVRMIPKIYDMPRITTIRREDGTEEHVMIDVQQDVPVKKVKRGEKEYNSYNPSIGKFAVAVTIGPSFATKRKESSAGMMAFMKVDPTAAPLISDLVAKVQDWEGSQEISKRLATRLPPGMLSPDSVDLTPQAQALIQQMQQQLQQLEQEKEQLIGALTEKNTEHMLEQAKIQVSADKVNKDFEAKLLALAQQTEERTLELINERLAQQRKDAIEIEGLDVERTKASAQLLQALTPEPTKQ